MPNRAKTLSFSLQSTNHNDMGMPFFKIKKVLGANCTQSFSFKRVDRLQTPAASKKKNPRWKSIAGLGSVDKKTPALNAGTKPNNIEKTCGAQIAHRRCGAPEGTRTPDLLIRSQTLYPAELRAHNCLEQLYYYSARFGICQQDFQKFLSRDFAKESKARSFPSAPFRKVRRISAKPILRQKAKPGLLVS